MTWKVLISAPYLLPFIDQYRPDFEANDIDITIADVEERLEEAELLKVIGDYDGIIAGDDRFTARVFEAAPKLKALIKWGTGIDSYDQQAAARHGVVIGRTVDAFTAAYPDVAVEWIRAGTTEVMARLEAEFAAGDPQPDVLLIAGVRSVLVCFDPSSLERRLAVFKEPPG